MELDKELEIYHRELPNLLDKAGKFVVIHQDAIAGIYDTYEDALSAGYKQAGLDPFLVKEIAEVEEPVTFVNNTVQPCRI